MPRLLNQVAQAALKSKGNFFELLDPRFVGRLPAQRRAAKMLRELRSLGCRVELPKASGECLVTVPPIFGPVSDHRPRRPAAALPRLDLPFQRLAVLLAHDLQGELVTFLEPPHLVRQR